MKIKLDENLPVRLAGMLASLGHDADSVFAEGLAGSSDPVVWHAAQAAGRFFITQDLDFSDLRAYQPGTHPGILVVRLRVPVVRPSPKRSMRSLRPRTWRVGRAVSWWRPITRFESADL